mgnify:CR=1 FL=1
MSVDKKNRPIVSKRQAMTILPMCDKEARDFLVAEGLVHKVRGRDMVVVRELEELIMSFDASGDRVRGDGKKADTLLRVERMMKGGE